MRTFPLAKILAKAVPTPAVLPQAVVTSNSARYTMSSASSTASIPAPHFAAASATCLNDPPFGYECRMALCVSCVLKVLGLA